MTSSILDWSTTAASNATADADINWQENQSPDTVNDSSRTMMARVAEWIKDSTPQRTSTGAANVYTVTSTSSPSALVDGFQIAFKAHQSNTGASTLAVNSFGAKPLRSRTGVALTANEILSGAAITAQYNSAADEFLLIGGRVGNSSADTLARIIPVGFVAPWPTATAPAGWLLAYGQAVSRTTYAELFAAYGTTYGSGDGSTTFNLPDYRGRTPFGKDDMGGSAAGRITFAASGVDGATLGATGGDQKHTLTSAQIPAHTHTATVSITSTPNTSIVENGNSGTVDVTSGSGNTVAKRSNVPNTISSTGTVTVNNTGGGGAHNNMPPAIIQNWIILALPAAAAAANLGVNGYYYQWSTTTTDTDPGTGKLGFNNSTLASATQLYISESDQLGNGMAPVLATWDDSTSATKGTLYVYKVGQLSTFAVFTITSTVTDGGSYDKFTVAHVASNGTFSDGDQLAVLFTPVGDKGDSGPGIDWQGSWLTATSYALADGVKNGGSSYICTLAHTSGASTEPGVGADWATVWDVIAEKGASGSGSGDMVAANNLSDVANTATSFNNIKQAASETATGVVELATTAEATTGTDTVRAVTPAGLKAHVDTVVATLPAVAFRTIAVSGQSDVVADTATDTLTLAAGSNVTITTNASTDTITIAASGGGSAPNIVEPINLGLAASVSGNALTIAVKTASGSDPSVGDPVLIPFRDATVATGTPSVLTLTGATSLTVSSGSTLGTSNSTPFRAWIVGLNDGGTFRLGIVNCVTSNGVFPLREGMLQSSTAEGGAGAADSAGVIYTGTAVTSKAMRILGYLEYQSGLATAGTYSSAPTLLHIASSNTKRPGDIVQTRVYRSAAYATGTGTIPHDDTIPQNTEGTQFMTLDITPTSVINRLLHDCPLLPATSSSAAWIIAALFQDSAPDAISSNATFCHSTVNAGVAIPLNFEMAAGTTSTTTFKVRIGGSAAGTISFVGASDNTRRLGGSKYQVYTIQEIMA